MVPTRRAACLAIDHEELRLAWAVALFTCLERKFATPSHTTKEGRVALARVMGVPTSEVQRALASTSIKALALWAATFGLLAMQQGAEVTIVDPSEVE